LSLFVDTSVWSLALRGDAPARSPEVGFLARAIENGETLLTTGLVLQELLQGFAGPKSRDRIVERFSAVPLLARIGRGPEGAQACRRALIYQ
jgi:predicted nucleic acid-binding protein